MPVVDPERLPEVAQAVELDLSRERPTVDEVNFDVRTPVIDVRAVFANGGLVARAFSFLMVGGGAAGVGYVTTHIAPPPVAMVAMVVVLFAGLIFVDRFGGK